MLTDSRQVYKSHSLGRGVESAGAACLVLKSSLRDHGLGEPRLTSAVTHRQHRRPHLTRSMLVVAPGLKTPVLCRTSSPYRISPHVAFCGRRLAAEPTRDPMLIFTRRRLRGDAR